MAAPFRPPLGTRFPRVADRESRFEAAGPLRGRLSLREILDHHDPRAAKFTLLRDHEGEVAGAVCFALREQDVMIEFLTRNDLFLRRGVPVGTLLVAAVETFARIEGREAIALEAMDDQGLIVWYKHEGFEQDGRPREDEEWGKLTPMVKRVAPAWPGEGGLVPRAR